MNLIIFGTRPEFLKLIPVLLEIRKKNLGEYFKLIFTKQHKELVEDLFHDFNIYPDKTLSINNNNLSIAHSLGLIINELQQYIFEETSKISHIIAQGDTTSCLAAAIVAKLNKIPFAHIEAGLRTFDFNNPYPEEYFRQIITLSSNVHFVPTKKAFNNLLHEEVDKDKIFYTGNTIVDLTDFLKNNIKESRNNQIQNILGKENVLITCHRRENQNINFDVLISTITELAHEYRELNFIWISHKNPFVESKLNNGVLKQSSNLQVIEPVNIFDMVHLYNSSKVILTDSGGIQEEAVSFNIPTIVLREVTERSEALETGNSILAGTSKNRIKEAFYHFINNENFFESNPFGDGFAAKRIVNYFENGNSIKVPMIVFKEQLT